MNQTASHDLFWFYWSLWNFQKPKSRREGKAEDKHG